MFATNTNQLELQTFANMKLVIILKVLKKDQSLETVQKRGGLYTPAGSPQETSLNLVSTVKGFLLNMN